MDRGLSNSAGPARQLLKYDIVGLYKKTWRVTSCDQKYRPRNGSSEHPIKNTLKKYPLGPNKSKKDPNGNIKNGLKSQSSQLSTLNKHKFKAKNILNAGLQSSSTINPCLFNSSASDAQCASTTTHCLVVVHPLSCQQGCAGSHRPALKNILMFVSRPLQASLILLQTLTLENRASKSCCCACAGLGIAEVYFYSFIFGGGGRAGYVWTIFALPMASCSKKNPELCVRHLDLTYHVPCTTHIYPRSHSKFSRKLPEGKNLIKYLPPRRKAEGRSKSQILLHFTQGCLGLQPRGGMGRWEAGLYPCSWNTEYYSDMLTVL